MGFRMPTDSFRMARIHPGHNGPPLLHNVIPDLTLDRVNSQLVLGAGVPLQQSWDPENVLCLVFLFFPLLDMDIQFQL